MKSRKLKTIKVVSVLCKFKIVNLCVVWKEAKVCDETISFQICPIYEAQYKI